MDSVARGTLINLGSRTATVALGLAITWTTARLGTQQQGSFALFTAVEAALLTLFSGLGMALARRISHHGERPTRLAGATVVASMVLGGLAAGALLALAAWAPQTYGPVWILALAAPLLLVAPNLGGIWLGLGRMRAMALIALGAPGLTLLGIGVAFVALPGLRIEHVLWAWVVARVCVSASVLLAARRCGWLGRPDFAALATQGRFVAAIGVTNLIGLLNYKVDLFLVQHFLGLSATGVYSIAVIVAELLWFLSSSVTQAAYARIGTRDAGQASRIVVRVVQCSFAALLVAAPLLWWTAALALPWLLGDAYRESLPPLAILLPGVLAFGAASALSAYFTNHAGRPLIPAALAGLSVLINVALSCLLIPRLGIIGGAIATSVSYAVAIAASFWVFVRLSGTSWRTLLRPDWRELVRELKRPLRAAGGTAT